jgi:hypothetical protein
MPVDGTGVYPGHFIDSPSTPQTRRLRVVAREDTRAPVATAVTLPPGPVDVRDSARRVRVVVDARDALSGVRSVQVSLTRDDQRVFEDHQAALRLVAGSRHAGRWRGHLVLPRLSPGGWRVAEATLVDRTGRSRSYRSNYDGPTPHPAGLRSVRLLSVRDRVPPETTAVTASPSAVDLRSASGTVTIHSRIRDAGSGVASASAWIQRGSVFEYEVPLRLVSGTRDDGMWRGSWTATTCQVQAGMRTVRVLARDRTGNRDVLGAAGPSLDVQNDDHTGPWVTASELTATSAAATFSEDVHGISPASALLRDPTADATTPAISGAWQCTSVIGVPVDCWAGPVRTARFVPDAPFPSLYLRLVINPEHVLDVTDGFGNPYFYVTTYIGYPPRR